MAENQNYIGVAMGLDVTDLKAGLSEANKQIQLANSEFKAASSGMDDWTKSTEGLSAKVKQLDAVLLAQRSKLAGLQAEYDKVAHEQGENSEAARKLKIQINNQQAVVNKTQKEFDKYTDALEQAKNGTIDIEQATENASEEVKDFGNTVKDAGKNIEGGFGATVAKGIVGGIMAIGAAAVAAVGSFLALAESTRETRANMAKLETGFTEAGLTAENASNTFKDMFSILGDEGQATEATAFLAKIADDEKELASATHTLTGIYATFGQALPLEGLTEAINHTASLGSVQGNLADALEWSGINVDDFNAQLEKCSSEEERQALIMSTLSGIYDGAADTYKETNAEVIASQKAQAELNETLAELGAIAEPIMTTLKMLANELLISITPFVELIGNGLRGALEGNVGAVNALAEGLSGIISVAIERIVAMTPFLIQTVVSMIQNLLPEILGQLPFILQTVLSVVVQVAQALAGMLPTLIPVVIDAVIMLAETLLDNIDMIIDAGIALLIGLADGLIIALPRLIDKVPTIIEKLLSALLNNLPKLVQVGIELIMKLASGLIKAIPQLVSKIPQIITSIVKGFAEYYSKMGNIGLNLVKGIWKGIAGGASWLKNKIVGFAGNVANWFKSTFQISSPSKLMENEIGRYLGEGIGVGVIDSIPTVKKQLGQFAGFVTDSLGGIKSGLAIEANRNANTNGGRSVGNTTINAGLTVNYNGNLSRKQIKQLETDNYTAIRMRLKAEGAI